MNSCKEAKIIAVVVVFRSRLQKERERDISEKIALGIPDARSGGGGEVQFDQRLFNQSKVRQQTGLGECVNWLSVLYAIELKIKDNT